MTWGDGGRDRVVLNNKSRLRVMMVSDRVSEPCRIGRFTEFIVVNEIKIIKEKIKF